VRRRQKERRAGATARDATRRAMRRHRRPAERALNANARRRVTSERLEVDVTRFVMGHASNASKNARFDGFLLWEF